MKNEQKAVETPIDVLMASITEEQAKFILHASVIAGHMPRHWLEEGIKLAKLVKNYD